MALNNDNSIKKSWSKPTVKDVMTLMEQAAARYNLADWKQAHCLVGVNERTFRRWKEKVDTEPNSLSKIPFWGYALLHTAATGESYIKSIECDWNKIPSEYIVPASLYKCPPKEVLTSLIGQKSITGQTRETIGQSIGIAPKVLAQQINFETVSFSTWSLLLLYCGVPLSKVFQI